MEKKEKFNKLKYNEVYEKETYTKITLRINKNTQKHIINKLNNVSSKNGYILSLIENDIKNNK